MVASNVGSNWDNNTMASFQAATLDVYPNGFLAIVAAKKGLTTSATRIIQRVESQRAVLGYVSIADVASAAKAKKILNI
jgi:arginine repressor